MGSSARTHTLTQLLFLLICLLPLALLFFLPASRAAVPSLWFFLVLFLCFFVLWGVLGRSAVARAAPAVPEEPRPIPAEELPEVVREVMDVRFALERNGVRSAVGRLREPADAAFDRLKSALSAGVVPLLQPEEQHGAVLILVPRQVEEAELERPVRPWLHWLLFGLTLLTTTWAGALQQGVNLLQEPGRFAVGLPFSLGLLAILGIHEMGHYITARRHGMRVTPPFFIPVPFALGTFGAFIKMKSPTENRRALFDVAVAGPLAGLVVAIPLLLIGLESSSVITAEELRARAVAPLEPAGAEGASRPGMLLGAEPGSSLLLALLAKLALPEALEQGCLLQLSPLAFAGWLGIFITGLNLVPIGQLDGGHTARAMAGHRTGQAISNVALLSLLFLGLFVWPGLLTWALIAFFLAGRTFPPLNDVTPLTPGRRWIGYATFAILFLILVPVPRVLWAAVGIHCPYAG